VEGVLGGLVISGARLLSVVRAVVRCTFQHWVTHVTHWVTQWVKGVFQGVFKAHGRVYQSTLRLIEKKKKKKWREYLVALSLFSVVRAVARSL